MNPSRHTGTHEVTWSIETSYCDTLAEGIQILDRALAEAQRIANRIHQTVYVYASNLSSDPIPVHPEDIK